MTDPLHSLLDSARTESARTDSVMPEPDAYAAAVPARVTEPVVTTLEALTAGPISFPTVELTAPPAQAVVLEQRGPSVDVVLDDGVTRSVYAYQSASLVQEPETQVRLLRTAISVIRTHLQQSAAHAHAAATAQQDRLDQIRRYAIDKHHENAICRDGLDKFLAEFDMNPYQERKRIRFTITGTYDIDPAESRNPMFDGSNHLDVDTSNIDGYLDDTLSINVNINSIEDLDDD